MGSHDFIEFPPQVSDLLPSTWLLLGEVQATLEVIRALPIRPDDLYDLQTTNLARAAHGTTLLEGNKLTENEVHRLVLGDLQVQLSKQDQIQPIQNMLAAFVNVAMDSFSDEPPPFSLQLLNRYHRLVMQGLDEPEKHQIHIGELRIRNVEVGRYLTPPADDCEYLLEQFCHWLNDDQVLSIGIEGYDLAWSVVKAILAHVYFAWIHPYDDGNGRMARLIEHAVLLREGVPAVASHIPSYFYSQTRADYYLTLQESHGEFDGDAYPAEGELRNFLEYALVGFTNGIAKQILTVATGQVQALWRDHIHACFAGNLTTARQRQLLLAVDLTDRCVHNPVELSDIRQLSAGIKLAYAGKSDDTLRRDLAVLCAMDLFTKDFRGYQPNPQILASFFGNAGDMQL